MRAGDNSGVASNAGGGPEAAGVASVGGARDEPDARPALAVTTTTTKPASAVAKRTRGAPRAARAATPLQLVTDELTTAPYAAAKQAKSRGIRGTGTARARPSPAEQGRVGYGWRVPKVLVAVLAGLLTCQLALLLTTMYLHRAVTHRAVTMRPALVFACRALLWFSTGLKPREWAAVHRRHHAYTDVLGDPHSPILEGYWKVQLYNVGLYKKAAKDAETLRKYSRDIKVDKWDKVLFDRGFIGLGLGYCVFWALFGWRLALVASAVHVVSYLLLNSAINAIGHRFGSRKYPGFSTNSQWLALLTWGEGLHSNHHAAPTAAKFSFTRREFDHGWLVIILLKKLGWLQVRHTDIHLTAAAQGGHEQLPPANEREPEPELV